MDSGTPPSAPPPPHPHSSHPDPDRDPDPDRVRDIGALTAALVVLTLAQPPTSTGQPVGVTVDHVASALVILEYLRRRQP